MLRLRFNSRQRGDRTKNNRDCKIQTEQDKHKMVLFSEGKWKFAHAYDENEQPIGQIL